jgi:hypothetical protein
MKILFASCRENLMSFILIEFLGALLFEIFAARANPD